MADEIMVLEDQAGVKEVKHSTVALIARATKFQVKDDASYEKAAGMLSEIAGARKKAEALRLSWTQPINQSLSNINSFFKKMTQPLDQAKDIIKEKAKDFRLEQEKKAREAERQRLLAEAKREEELKKALEEGKPIESVKEVSIPEVKILSQTVRSAQGKAMTAKHSWKHEVIDPELVPRIYWEINESLIRGAVNRGEREIPGVRIYSDIDISVRS